MQRRLATACGSPGRLSRRDWYRRAVDSASCALHKVLSVPVGRDTRVSWIRSSPLYGDGTGSRSPSASASVAAHRRRAWHEITEPDSLLASAADEQIAISYAVGALRRDAERTIARGPIGGGPRVDAAAWRA